MTRAGSAFPQAVSWFLLLVLALLVPRSLFARQAFNTVRIASYNLLNYPGTDASTRNPYFRRGVLTMDPDILVVGEMQSQSGTDLFRSDVLNYYQPNRYSSIPFHDGPDTDHELFFKPDKVTFVSANYIPTDLRDIAEYTVALNGTNDTLRIYGLHLKASSGSTNEQQRLAEATTLRNYLNTLPPGSKFIIVGDYNTYYSTEPCLVKLEESQAIDNGRAKDPLNSNGTWHATPSFAPIHTQSPRVRQFGGGSNGGMDDRFDLIMTSYASLDSNIILPSYTAYGNDGNHFNDSINRLPNTAVPDSVANGLHYASDHLPVYCDFRFPLSGPPPPLGPFSLLTPPGGSAHQPLSGTLRWQRSAYASDYTVSLDTLNPPAAIVSTGSADTAYAYAGLRAGGVTYYWQVTARRGADSLIAGDGITPFQFTTLNTYTITSSHGPNGTLNPGGSLLLLEGANQSYSIGPSTGYHIDSVIVDGLPVTPPETSYTFSNVQSNHTIHASFAIDRFAITASAGAHGTISPAGTVSVDYGSEQSFAITPDAGYHIDSVVVDGSFVGTPEGYSFTNVHLNHTIRASFTTQGPPVTLALSVTAGWNMIALPIDVVDAGRESLFPGATGTAFSYDGSSYLPSESLSVSTGYWLKFPRDSVVVISGRERLIDTITVGAGWNLIGSSFDNLGLNAVEQIPGGILGPHAFTYRGTYLDTDMLMRGKAYWVKASAPGLLILRKP